MFVAHREEILQQAARSFRNVRHSEDYGFFTGKEKSVEKSVIFASVATLGRTAYLNERYFSEDYFDYIVIDEFHHAVTEQYKRIMLYFKPEFMLGLTATPERMDGRSIYKLCDYNVPYQISLQDAINKGMLVPFHYYGIYDETVDYSGIRKIKGKYDEAALTKELLVKKRHTLIYKHYMKFKMKIHEDDIYQSYLKFYSTANNWKDLEKDKGTSDFKTWDKKRCVSEALKNPVKFLMESGKGFFVKKEGMILALNEQLGEVVKQVAFEEQMGDIIDYRTMDYYRRRYESKSKGNAEM